MPRIKLTIAYKGGRFAGWQVQEQRSPNAPLTVQGCLEDALQRILGRHVRIHGAGRTDAGVHALGQVAHVDIPEDRLAIDWQQALNSTTPQDISVLALERVPEEFHARYSAKGKTYAYHLWLDRRAVLPQRKGYVWVTGPLDLQAMEAASLHFIGEHDFAAFQNQGSDSKTTVRRIDSLELEQVSETWPEMALRISGNGFLKQMVRNMVGCLVAVGEGKLRPEAVAELLAQGDRRLCPRTAPAWGLTLEAVHY